MINKELLKIIWNNYHFTYKENVIFFGNKKLNIFICNNSFYEYVLKVKPNYNKRKNCIISNQLGDKRNIIIHENHIISIIRQKIINNILK